MLLPDSGARRLFEKIADVGDENGLNGHQQHILASTYVTNNDVCGNSEGPFKSAKEIRLE